MRKERRKVDPMRICKGCGKLFQAKRQGDKPHGNLPVVCKQLCRLRHKARLQNQARLDKKLKLLEAVDRSEQETS